MKAVVLLSGGLDSATAAYWYAKRRVDLTGVCFDYGQRHVCELEAAAKIAQQLAIPLHTVHFSLDFLRNNPLAGTSRAAVPKGRSEAAMAAGVAPTFVPGRNTLFLAFGLSLAEATGSEALIVGASRSDREGYPDCRDPYFAAYETMANLAMGNGTLRVLRPFVDWKKSAVVQAAVDMKVPIELTRSCYEGGELHCGGCDACVTRRRAFIAANEHDPTEYAA